MHNSSKILHQIACGTCCGTTSVYQERAQIHHDHIFSYFLTLGPFSMIDWGHNYLIILTPFLVIEERGDEYLIMLGLGAFVNRLIWLTLVPREA
jgi:hypothetical protein